MGKAGGGTIYRDRIERIWRLQFHQCHHRPCRPERYQNKKILIDLRDPVDRFISAVYWRIKLHCDPAGDKRKPIKWTSNELSHSYCRTGEGDAGVHALFHKYGKDVNRLLHSLCSANKTETEGAEQDIRNIKHLQDDIVDWLTPALFDRHADNVFPIVMDSAIPSIVSQTDDAVQWLHNQTKFEPASNFSKRHEMIQTHDACHAEKKVSEEADRNGLVHSSGTSNKTSVLFPEREKCLVQFYRRDYEALAKAKESLCKTSVCKKGIQSILDRRAPLLR